MKLYVDLHIHTALSPCGSNDMTPNNIVNMAKIKGLDAIAITDHNSCENAAACMEVGKKTGIAVIPGMEVQTKEDIHVITLFNHISSALEFQKYIYSGLTAAENREDIFGEQLVLDRDDNIIGHNKRMLITSVRFNIDEVFKTVTYLNGVFIPAHVDREAYSIIYSLGFIPENLNISVIEYSSKEKLQNLINRGMLRDSYKFIKSSDAHYLEDISERDMYLDCDSNNLEHLLKAIG